MRESKRTGFTVGGDSNLFGVVILVVPLRSENSGIGILLKGELIAKTNLFLFESIGIVDKLCEVFLN